MHSQCQRCAKYFKELEGNAVPSLGFALFLIPKFWHELLHIDRKVSQTLMVLEISLTRPRYDGEKAGRSTKSV